LQKKTRYDDFGRPSLTTLPAPTKYTEFCYEPHFVTVDDPGPILDYGTWAYDMPTTTLNNPETCFFRDIWPAGIRSIRLVGEYADIHVPKGCDNSSMSISSPTTGAFLRIADIDKNFEATTLSYAASHAGYYRMYNSRNSSCIININYELNYYNFTLYYYDYAGKLIASVPPQGVDYSHEPTVGRYNYGGSVKLNSLPYSANYWRKSGVTYNSTLPVSGEFDMGYGTIYLATTSNLSSPTIGCYYCEQTLGVGTLTHLSANLAGNGLKPSKIVKTSSCRLFHL